MFLTPLDVTVNCEFDESPTVVAAVDSVATEGMIGAGLTGLMILLFLGDPRSVIVVVSNIPLALLGSLVGLWVTGNTINIMSLGGMALAIGILVDKATTIENVHDAKDEAHAEHRHGGAAREQRHGGAAARWLLHLVGVHPGVHHERPAAVASVPLTLGVGFAMIVVPASEHVRCTDPVRGPAETPRGHGASSRGL
jgi:hypothetical protein